ncbi:hypothetical protein NFI96_000804 [Prochilodus magdalenae]|nr:hypothetical protein NFI96_000804 [Prochilodus magdalenae]
MVCSSSSDSTLDPVLLHRCSSEAHMQDIIRTEQRCARHKRGLTQTKIAEQLGISQSSVCKALKKNCSKRTNCSGVRKTSARDNKQLRKIAVSNRFKSTSELNDLWNKQTGADVSRSTTYRRLRELGFKSHVPAVKPMLNKKQMEKRLKWAKEHGESTAEDWQKVVFSDESRFCISFGDQGPRVWRRGGETYNHECVKRSVKFPQSVMVWGCMSARGVGKLCFLKKTVNAAVYQDVLETFLIPTVEEQFGEEDFIFQQDLAPAHAAKSTKDWFTKKQLEVLAWPANSPDLNVIENLWAIVKRKIRDRKPTTLDQLKQNIATAWEALCIVHCVENPPLSMTSDPDPLPSRSEQCSKKEHPVTSYTALSPWLSSFSISGVSDYSQLTIDLSRNQLIVGARNYLFRLSLADLSLLQSAEWGVDEDTRRSCQSKGKTEDECQNYVRVLLLSGPRLFTCGTNAFSPVCTTRPVSDLAQVFDAVNGVARCPYDPKHNSTAMLTDSGELYAATVIDFSGRDPVIYRSLGSMPPLRTAQYNSKWLNEPHFVSAYEVGRFTYFFLRETAVEQDCGKAVFSRVARVCQNDVGGRFLLEDTWTTFMKARLNCSRSGDVPFYYNELQSTFYLPEQDIIYGVFTTNVNSIAASAVCAFNLSAITQAFNGPFRYQENPRTSWLSTPNPIPNFQCGTVGDGGPGGNLTERSLQDAQRLFLMSDVVQPISVNPLISQDNIRFSKLAVDIVQGQDTLYHVIYIGTEHGTIIKALSTSNKSLHGCYLEEMKLLPEDKWEPILNLQILQSDRSLFVGLNSRVLKIPLERCSNYQTQRECLDARDPYCGWDRKQRRCSTIEESSNMSQWIQNITHCPEYKACNLEACAEVRRNTPWSSWYPVNVTVGGARQEQRVRFTCRALLPNPHDLQLGKRKLETRTCPASSGGPGCETDGLVEDLVRVSPPLTRIQGATWSPWETWSSCSKECSRGFRTRKRSCLGPDGKSSPFSCSGTPVEYQDCNTQPCPGGWGMWSEWSECEEGFQHRSRTCEISPTPCEGNGSDWRICGPRESAVGLPGQKRGLNCGGISQAHMRCCIQCCDVNCGTLTLNKNNLLPDESCNFFPSPLQQTNVYATTYYPTPLGKYDFPSLDSPCRSYMHS